MTPLIALVAADPDQVIVGGRLVRGPSLATPGTIVIVADTNIC